VFKTVFLGSDYDECRKGVDEAVLDYASVMTNLGVAIGVQNYIQTTEVLKRVQRTNSLLFGTFHPPMFSNLRR